MSGQVAILMCGMSLVICTYEYNVGIRVATLAATITDHNSDLYQELYLTSEVLWLMSNLTAALVWLAFAYRYQLNWQGIHADPELAIAAFSTVTTSVLPFCCACYLVWKYHSISDALEPVYTQLVGLQFLTSFPLLAWSAFFSMVRTEPL